jgi:pyruvate ferredoxin oxidoreductase gamma subunit
MIVINTSKSPEEIKASLKNKKVKTFTVDASKIARETIGRDIPNTPMLGAMAAATGLLNYERLLKDLEQKLNKKFASKKEIVAGNLNAVKRAYEEVKK